MAAKTERTVIGQYRGVTIELVTVDSTGAEVDLSCACMFTHEINQQPLAGGLANLDAALGGQLSRARSQGAFSGRSLETLLIDRAPASAKSPTLLVIGMGEPEAWTPDTSAAAVACALRVGHLRGARSVAIAPSILDTGIRPDGEFNTPMLRGLKAQLDALHLAHQLGLSRAPGIERWVFDTGAANYAQKVLQYQSAFAAVMGSAG